MTRAPSGIFACIHCSRRCMRPGCRPVALADRSIRLIVPFPRRGSSDIVARIVAQKLGDRLKQQVFVDNRVGASGNIGSEAVARAEPDGYTMGLANTTTHAVAPSFSSRLGYDPVKDFAPVSMLGSSPFVLAVYPGLPAKTVAELIALAKAKPRSLTYASAGLATLAHLSGALFEKMAKIEMVHVPYRGTAPAALDLMEGRVDMQFGTIPPSIGNIREGRLRALGISGTVRNVALPDVPTIAEAGLPGYEVLALAGPCHAGAYAARHHREAQPRGHRRAQ